MRHVGSVSVDSARDSRAAAYTVVDAEATRRFALPGAQARAFLRLEKLRRPDWPGAVGLALAAVIVALGAAPVLNRDSPWFDYETWAAESARGGRAHRCPAAPFG